jgi:hypothetical protein
MKAKPHSVYFLSIKNSINLLLEGKYPHQLLIEGIELLMVVVGCSDVYNY